MIHIDRAQFAFIVLLMFAAGVALGYSAGERTGHDVATIECADDALSRR